MKTNISNISIEAIAAYLPTESIELSSMKSLFGEEEVNKIIKLTDIERVRVAQASETSSDMCSEAAIHLLKCEGIRGDSIDGLVFVSQTSDYLLPASSIILQDRLNLKTSTVCVDLPFGCSGYIYGLFQASLLINSHACDRVLVLSGDTTTKIIHPLDKAVRMIFGDSGTATLVSRGSGYLGVNIYSDGSGRNDVIVPAGGFRMPASDETKEIIYDSNGNGRTQENLYMDGMAAYGFAVTKAHLSINDMIEQMEWTKDSVDLFALHQANKFMVNGIRKKIRVEPEKVPVNVVNYGNTGPASIPLLLSEISPDQYGGLKKVIMSAIGVGHSWGSIGCTLENTRFYEPLNK
jgi:3-oxoacyl-[acyl-carrier-protein] synthase III